jgi:hypothetical protein
MTEIITAEAISRRKALTLLGLATVAFAASSVVVAPDAEAQTVGMERRQGRRTGRLDVEAQQVVLGEAEAADGCVGF